MLVLDKKLSILKKLIKKNIWVKESNKLNENYLFNADFHIWLNFFLVVYYHYYYYLLWFLWTNMQIFFYANRVNLSILVYFDEGSRFN